MSTIVDDPDVQFARRIASEREKRNWSLADLARHSGVSKAMLSKIERCEASPTALILSRIATAFGLTLASLLVGEEERSRLLRAKDQPAWRDPVAGYVRKQVFLSAGSPLELVAVEMPAGGRVAFPASVYALTRHVVWIIDGRLTIAEGDVRHAMMSGDRLEFGPPSDMEFRNEGSKPCRYLVAVLRQ